jgi:hypothetical protein
MFLKDYIFLKLVLAALYHTKDTKFFTGVSVERNISKISIFLISSDNVMLALLLLLLLLNICRK